ncbi:phage protein TIGR01671 [[Clostridium] sordellii]|uniref:YopX family protein n=1 Tax=Paraclostridium sordellii TaxID=1505 RepID=UPI0005E6EB91|nr:YopX family protein [Paeniclostridium sordellii]CEQ01595.1 phage protein TIGR01671 [[Clostridium] sordellii] [Paeniclostridium sordellii]
MREIKFRTWNKSENKMYYNAELTYDFGMNGSNVMEESFGGIITNDDFILMQYTGLKDIKGKEIYEGDIVKFHSQYYQEDIVGSIKFGYGMYFIDDGGFDLYAKHDICEVIGNIYNDKELLKRG